MRQITHRAGLGTVLLLSALAGCSHFGSRWSNPTGPQASTETPTCTALVSYLNDNARRLQSIECQDLGLDCRQGIRSFWLNGNMVCQKPRNFRMGARVGGKEQVDMGSNNQEFWFWIAQGDPAYQFHCSYEDFQRGPVALPFPFQPEWIMQALGMAEYDKPADTYQVRVQRDTVELIETAKTPQGQPMQKVTVFQRNPVQRAAPQVQEHLLKDAAGKVICSAKITEVQVDRNTGGVLPKRITLNWPAENLSLGLKLDDVTINREFDANAVARLFSRPTLANVPGYDLARRSLDAQASSIRRVNGTVP